MSGDDLFAAEERIIAAAEQLLADDGDLARPGERQHFEQLLKNYQKLFRTARRLMRLGDHNERQLNAAAAVIAQKNSELQALSIKLSKYLSPQIYNSIFSGAQGVEIASNRKKLTIFFSDVVNFTETTEKLESEELTNLLNRYLTEMSDIALQYGATIDKYHRRRHHGVLRRSGDEGRQGGCPRLRAHGDRHAEAHARAPLRMAGTRRREAIPAYASASIPASLRWAISAAASAWTIRSSATP